ncbi:hypothetical protein AALA80_12450 [Oscillospiraceae bacterium 50-60]
MLLYDVERGKYAGHNGQANQEDDCRKRQAALLSLFLGVPGASGTGSGTTGGSVCSGSRSGIGTVE